MYSFLGKPLHISSYFKNPPPSPPPPVAFIPLKLDNIQFNRPLPSSKNPNVQNEAKCTTFLVKMSFTCMRIKNNLHFKS